MPRRTRSFVLGPIEVTDAAGRSLSERGLSAQTFVTRHASGDWGSAPDWCKVDNDRVAELEAADHPIRSIYRIDDDVEILVITAPDRSRTKVQLATEYVFRASSAPEGYDIWAGWYDVWNPLVATEEPHVRATFDALMPLARAVDVGTGTGRHALYLASRGVDVVAFDQSDGMLEAARRKATRRHLTNVRFEQATLGDGPLPAEDESFDVAVSALMLTHVEHIDAAIADIVRLVRQGGHVVVSDFHPSAVIFGWRGSVVTPDEWINLPCYAHGRDGYLDALTAAGCRVRTVIDLSTEGEPYGDTSPDAVKARGRPPLCIVIVAAKE